MKMTKFLPATIVAIAILAVSPLTSAQWGGMPGSKSSEAKTAVDIDGLLNRQKGLMGRFNSSMHNMLTAQALTLEALGLKAEGDTASKTAAYYGAGNVADKDQIKRDIKVSQSADKLISAEMAKGQKLSDESKATLAAALPSYGVGLHDGIKLPGEFGKWGSSVTGDLGNLKSNPIQAMKLKNDAGVGLYVGQQLPDLISTWSTSTKNVLAFAKGNGIDVSGVESKLGDL